MSEHAQCDTCIYWSKHAKPDGRGYMACNRFPPTGDDWAMTKHDDWCGEWRERERDPMDVSQR